MKFRTHWMNHQSPARSHTWAQSRPAFCGVMSDGSLRDTVVFSIIQSEWPGVRNELRRRLAVHR